MSVIEQKAFFKIGKKKIGKIILFYFVHNFIPCHNQVLENVKFCFVFLYIFQKTRVNFEYLCNQTLLNLSEF